MTHPAMHLDYKEILKYYQELEDRRKYNEETYNFLKYGYYTPPQSFKKDESKSQRNRSIDGHNAASLKVSRSLDRT